MTLPEGISQQKEVKLLLSYKTVNVEASSELVIKKSKFIASVKPVQSEGEAMEFIHLISKIHREATHNVYAYRISENQEKSSDDGEPSGTAGRPVLNVIRESGLVNVALVVTRYFGGVMLGAGGLVRAYTQAAAQGINAAGVVERKLWQLVSVQFELSLFGLVKKALEKAEAEIIEVAVTDQAVIKARLPWERIDRLTGDLIELSTGRAVVKRLGQKYH